MKYKNKPKKNQPSSLSINQKHEASAKNKYINPNPIGLKTGKVGDLKTSKKFTFLDFMACVMIILYIYVTRQGPREAFDVSTSRWQYLSIINCIIISYVLILKFFDGDMSNKKVNIYSNNIFLSFAFMVSLAGLSVSYATNFGESIINFGRLSATFIVFVNVAYLIQSRLYLIDFLTKCLILYALFDVLVLIYIAQDFLFGNGPWLGNAYKGILTDSDDLANPWHGGYANRNIYSAAIALKAPFVLYGSIFYRGIWRNLSLVVFVLCLLSIFFLSTRSIYISVLFLSIASSFGIYFLYRNGTLSKVFLRYIPFILVSMVVSMLSVNMLMKEKRNDIQEGNYVLNRLATLTDKASKGSSVGNRLDAARRSWYVFKQHPVMGIGIGNWKVDILEFESPEAPQFVLMKHAHNDFIEYGVELGLLGFLAYLGLFVFSIFTTIRILKSNLGPSLKVLGLLGGIALITYIPDAISNFPSERTELQIFLAFILAINTAVFYQYRLKNTHIKPLISFPLKYLHIILLIVSLVFYKYSNDMFESSKIQKFAFQDYNSRHVDRGPYRFAKYIKENKFPSQPTMDEICTPISVIRGLYLMNEKKYREAIRVMKKDDENPYHMRKEFLIADCYNRLGQRDSALVYVKKVLRYKPLLQDNVILAATLYNQKQEFSASEALLKDYLSKNKRSINAWTVLLSTYQIQRKNDLYLQTLDSAVAAMPNHIPFKRRKLAPKVNLGNRALRNKDYKTAIKHFTEIYQADKTFYNALQSRALAYFELKDYAMAENDFRTLSTARPQEGSYHFYLGLSLYYQQKTKPACDSFTEGAKLGHKESIQNMRLVCTDLKQNLQQFNVQ